MGSAARGGNHARRDSVTDDMPRPRGASPAGARPSLQVAPAEAKRQLQEALAAKISRMESATESTVRSLIESAVAEAASRAPGATEEDRRALVSALTSEFLGLGPLDALLADPTITEIMVNGGGVTASGKVRPPQVFVERGGVIEPRPDVAFDGEEHVVRIMNRILGRQGRHIDERNPIEDGTLPDGSRFSGAVYPVSRDGSSFNIRMFGRDVLTVDDLVALGAANWQMMGFLSTLVAARGSVLVCGGTSSGKTSLLNALAGFIPETERVITIEDTCELRLGNAHGHVVRYEARRPNSEGLGEVSMEQLLVSALRRRPDRIVVGEVRGREASVMLEAMSVGHDGSMTTLHANGPGPALNRLVTLVRQGDAAISEDVARQRIADALDCIVHVQRLSDGSRRVVGVEAVGGYVDGAIQRTPLFEFVREGMDPGTLALRGRFRACGTPPPALRRKIADEGYEFNAGWFLNDGM